MISITEINKNIQEAIRKARKSLTCNMKECDYTSVFAVEFPNVLKKVAHSLTISNLAEDSFTKVQSLDLPAYISNQVVSLVTF